MEENETMEGSLEESLEEFLEEELVEESEESLEESTQKSSEALDFNYDRLESIVLETKDTFNQPLATLGLLSILGFIGIIIFAVILLKEV